MHARMRRLADARWKGLFAALFLGALAALGQAPLGFYPVSVIAFALGLGLVLEAGSWRRAGVLGWALATGFFGVGWLWIVEPFLVDIRRHGWMAPFALILLAGGVALFWGVAAGVAGRVRSEWRWLALPAALALAEYARGWAFTGFSWGGPGLAWIDTPMAQLAPWIGAQGLGALTLVGAGALYRAIYGRVTVAAWLAGLAVFVGLGIWADRRPLPPTSEDAPVLRLVQPNAPQHLKWDPDWIMTFFERALAASSAEAEGGRPDLVVWPESSLPALLGQAPAMEARAIAAAAPAPLVAGVLRRDGATYHNSIVFFDGPGEPAWVYDKHHLVPFGEYVPFGDLLSKVGIRGLAQQEGFGFSGGPGPVIRTLPGALGDVVPLICYEAIFPRDIRGAEGRSDWLMQLTNDAWFGTFAGPQQHLVQARFRAIEFGLPLARAANTGISAMIDSRGRITASLPLGAQGFVDARLPAPEPPTVYARWGDWPVIALLVAILGTLLFTARRKTR